MLDEFKASLSDDVTTAQQYGIFLIRWFDTKFTQIVFEFRCIFADPIRTKKNATIWQNVRYIRS